MLENVETEALAVGNTIIRQDDESGNLLVYRDDGSGEMRVVAVFFNTEEGVVLSNIFAAWIAELLPHGAITIATLDADMRSKIIIPDTVQ